MKCIFKASEELNTDVKILFNKNIQSQKWIYESLKRENTFSVPQNIKLKWYLVFLFFNFQHILSGEMLFIYFTQLLLHW